MSYAKHSQGIEMMSPHSVFFPTAEGYYDVKEKRYVYNYTDHLGNIRLSYSRSGIIETNHYYPFGLKHEGYDTFPKSIGGGYQYKYNGKELQTEIGMYDYGARFYMPDVGIFGQHDPLSEKTMQPYAYVYNNPIKYIDPTGMEPEDVDDVIITGNKSKEVFNQLKYSTSLKLKMDDNGRVTASGKAITDVDRKLLEATKDANVVVQINATSSNFTESGHWYIGGAYGGSTVGADGKIYTTQTINPEMTGKIDEFYGRTKGVTVMHEVIESYIGGVESPGVGAPTFDSTTIEFKAYEKAHNKELIR